MTKLNQSRVLTIGLLAGGMLLFGLATPLSKLVGRDFPVYLAAFLRTGLTGLILTPILWNHRTKLKQLGQQDYVYLFLIALVGTAGFTVFLLEGTARIPGVVSSALMSFVPLVTALGAVFFFSSKFTKSLGLSLLLAIAGVLIINLSQSQGDSFSWNQASLLGIIFVLLAIFSEATFTLSGKKLSLQLNPLIITGLASLLASLVLLPLAIYQLSGWDYTQVSWRAWIYLLVWAVGTLGLGTWVWYSGLKRAESLKASVFMAIMPLSALVFSYILLGEAFRLVHLAGLGLVLTAIILSQSKQAGH